MPTNLKLVVVTATSFTNQTNEWIYVYGNAPITSLKDAAGNSAGTTSAPFFIPPGWVVASATELQGLQGNLEDFAGFLSSGGANLTGFIADANLLTGYTKVYTNVAIGAAVATGAVAVTNGGLVIGNLNSGGFYAVSLAGSVTTPTAHTGGSLPNSIGFQSAGGRYFMTTSDTVSGFEVFKDGAFFFEGTTSLAHAATHFGFSPNGKYIALVDPTDNTIELWVGA